MITSRTRITRKSHADQGFTLVELVIVIVVIGILSGITILAVGQFKSGADSNSCEVDKQRLETAITAYRASRDNNPDSLAAMTTTSPPILDAEDVVGSTLVRDSYTLTYTPGTGVNDCVTALAAGGGSPTAAAAPTGTATATASPTATATATPTASATATPAAPTISACTPSDIPKGTWRAIDITGTNFNTTDSMVAVSGTKVTATVTSRTATLLKVTLSADNGATQNARSITVSSTLSGTTVTRNLCVTIT